MSFCRPVDEIDVLWVGDEAFDVIGSMDIDELILSVRNGDIYQLISNIDDTKDDNENVCRVMDLIEDIRESITVLGLIRPDIMYVSSPEMYFVIHYIKELGLDEDYRSKYMPYFESNEEYESYMFCYERIERVYHVLSSILDEDEIYEVVVDTSYLDPDICDAKILASAKKKLTEHRDEIIHDLEQAFAMF